MDQELTQLLREFLRDNPVYSEATEESLVKEYLRRGIPPSRVSGVPELRTYPRSNDHNGHQITTTAATINFEGPFGPVVAVYVDNRSTSAEIILIGNGQSSGIRVGTERRRRLEFDTPTDSSGNRVTRLTFTLVATAIDAAAKVYLEVE